LNPSRVGAEWDPDSLSRFSIKSEIWISLRLSANSSMSRLDAGVDASDSLGLAMWLSKLPELLAMQTQVLKKKALPSSSVTVRLNDAIELARGSSMSTPTWRAYCRCLTSKPIEGYPSVVDCR
jgi:hypothetical protein